MGGGGGGETTCASLILETCPMTDPFPGVYNTIEGGFRCVNTTGCPPYSHEWTAPNEACIFDTKYCMRLVPRFASTPIPVGEALQEFDGITYLREDPMPIFGSIGVYDNGVFIFGVGAPCGGMSPCPDQNSAAPSVYVDAVESEGPTFDGCDGHASPMGQYHIHSGNALSTDAQRIACGLPLDTPGEHSVRLGWMFDGFGIYGRYSQGGQVPIDLDECSGHTHEIDGVMTYHYHLPDEYPWTIGCFKGCPNVINNQRQLSYANNGSYGCPEGLVEDPNPLVELPPGSGTVGGPVIHTTLIFVIAAMIFLGVTVLPED